MKTCKIMLLGDMGVGKTSIAKQLVFGSFEGEYSSTIGVDIYTYDVEPPPADEPFKFLVWDTDGSFGESYLNLIYIRQAQAALVVADVTRPATVQSAAQLASRYLEAMPGRYLAAVLNKCDLLADGETDEDSTPLDLPDLLKASDIPVVRTSAKTGFGVRDAFHQAAVTIVRRGLA